MEFKVCDCEKITKPLLVVGRESAVNKTASEWYCEKCHKSFPMTETEYVELKRMGFPQ